MDEKFKQWYTRGEKKGIHNSNDKYSLKGLRKNTKNVQ
jgi:hypothetical protein